MEKIDIEKIKPIVLEQLEKVAIQGVESIFSLIYAYIDVTPTKVDDAIKPFLEKAKEFVLKQVSKIDGN